MEGGVRQACPAASGLITGGAATLMHGSTRIPGAGGITHLEIPLLERDGKPSARPEQEA